MRPGVQGPKAHCWLKNKIPPPTPSVCCISGIERTDVRSPFSGSAPDIAMMKSTGKKNVMPVGWYYDSMRAGLTCDLVVIFVKASGALPKKHTIALKQLLHRGSNCLSTDLDAGISALAGRVGGLR